MENWENKLIADKLNSLEELPEGYSPNMASKWEIIQSGLQQKRKRVHVAWWIAFVLALLTGLAIWIDAFEKQPADQALTPKENTEPSSVKLIPPLPAKPSPQSTVQTTAKDNQHQKLTKSNQLSGRPRAKPVFFQSNIYPLDSVRHIRTDTLRISVPLAELKLPKPKRRAFQKDFEGFASSVDTVQPKTASKGIQFTWRSRDEKITNSEEPKLRLIQKF